LGLFDETASTHASTQLPNLDHTDSFYAEIYWEDSDFGDYAPITPLTLSTTFVPESSVLATMGVGI
jgi:hypothetical protein